MALHFPTRYTNLGWTDGGTCIASKVYGTPDGSTTVIVTSEMVNGTVRYTELSPERFKDFW